MGEEKETKQLDTVECLIDETENVMKTVFEEGITYDNIDFLGKIVDVFKDLNNITYWDVKKEDIEMRYSRGNYGNYGNYGTYDDSYGRGRRRDSRGRYMTNGSGRYSGHEMMNEMGDHYGRYMESHSRYGTGSESMESLEYMLQSAYDFMKHISEEAGSQEEMELVKEYADKISRI